MADWIMTGLLHGTALAALTGLAAATLLRRARPALLAALWTVVLFKFLVPIGPRSPLSLSSAIDHLVPWAGGALAEPVAAASASHTGIATHAAAGEGGGGWLFGSALLVAYAAGLAVIAARRVARHRALFRHVRALPLASADVVRALERLAASFGRGAPARLPVLRISPDASSPYLVGCIRPQLVLPEWLDHGSPAWSAALAHELAHVARRDPWWRVLESVASALFYFWPPVAWVCRRLDRAREMACDQWAVARGPLSAREYGRLLVELATRAPRRQGAALVAPGAMALVRTRSQLAARVDQLLAGARPPALGRGRLAFVAVWAGLCLAGAARGTSAALAEGQECGLDPELMAQILASHPKADADGNGMLSQDEACAHQQRMRQRLLDRVVDAELVSRLDPEADVDGDGELSDFEIDSIKHQFELEMAPDRGDAVVLHYAGAPVSLSQADVRVSAAAASGPVCRAGRCSDTTQAAAGEPAGQSRFPFLIDVSPTTQE